MSRRSFGVVVRAILAVIVVRFMVGQGVAWNRAERFIDRIPALQVDDLSTVPATVNRLRDASGFAASRVYEPLANRMLELAEPTIADYRNDMPTAKLPQWKDAATALKIAQDVQPGDRRVRARVRYVDGQLLRIEAQSRQPDMARPLLDRAVAAFREAARLDGGWPDPFLGLAAVHAYGLHDADSVVQDISEAANRGFSGGRREHAEVADVFAFRADQLRATARSAEGDEKRRLLSAARDDYQACIDNYEGVIGFFNSDRNLERCRRLHDAVAVELEAVPLFELSIGPF
jgi:hypothetical protein